jgi:hypothetical protein
MNVIIVEEQGTHLLIGCGDRFAVVERRNNRLYNCHDGKRDSIPLSNLSIIANILHQHDWTDRATAQAAFDKVHTRWTDLSEHMR